MNFGDRLATAVRRAGNPVVVGLDPRFHDLPDAVKNCARRRRPSRPSGSLFELLPGSD